MSLMRRLLPGADLGLGLLLGDAVASLDLADELVAAALDRQQIVVGELAPLLLHGALGLVVQLPLIFSQIVLASVWVVVWPVVWAWTISGTVTTARHGDSGKQSH